MTNFAVERFMKEIDRFTLHDLMMELQSKGFISKEWVTVTKQPATEKTFEVKSTYSVFKVNYDIFDKKRNR